MATLLERHDMIIGMMNDRERLMQPISRQKFQEIADIIGMKQLAVDINYLIEAGLVNPNAVKLGGGGGGDFVFNIGSMSLTANGVDYANADTIGNKLKVVNIQIHQNTLDKLEAMINASEISDAEKKTLLQLIKEKGADAVIGRMVDYAFANIGIASKLFAEAAKDKLGFHD